MAIKKTIEIQVNTSSAEKNVNNLTDEFNDLGKAVKNTDKEIDDLGKAQKKSSKSTRDLTNDIQSNGGAMGILNSLTGGMAQGFKDAYEAIQLSSVGLSGFKKALIATGIGAIVVAIGLLVAHWEDLSGYITASGRALKSYNDEQDRLKERQEGLTSRRELIEAEIELARLQGKEITKLQNELSAILRSEEQSAQDSYVSGKLRLKELQDEALELEYLRSGYATTGIIDKDEQKLIDAQAQLVDELKASYVSASAARKRFQDSRNIEAGVDTSTEGIEAATEAAIEAERTRLQKLRDLRKKAYEAARTADATDAVKKKELEKTRALEELIALGASEEQKNQLIAFYDGQIFDLKEIARQKEIDADKKAQEESNKLLEEYYEEQERIITEKEDKRLEDERKARVEAANEAEIRIQLKQDIAYASVEAFDVISGIAGEETKLGKAMLVFKQGAMLAELAIEVSKTIAFSQEAAARSAVAIAEGAAQTAKVGFPQNIPLLISYAAQAAAIIATLVKATKSSSGSQSSGTYTGPTAPTYNIVGTSGVTQNTQSTISAQDRDTYNQPVQTYITTAQVTTALALERQLASQSQLGT